MHRLGNLAHLPAALTPSLAASAASSVASSLSAIPASNTLSSNISSNADPWAALHVHVLPLFNGEPLRIPIEDLNVLVQRHIQSVMSAPHKAIATLENDVSELISSGMVTLKAKLVDIKDDKLVSRIVETWGFFWDQVLTYVEGVLLPIQIDPLLLNLYRTPKTHRPSSPTLGTTKGPMSAPINPAVQISTAQIDIRSVALCSFRDRVILPFVNRLSACLSGSQRQDSFHEQGSYQQPRLQQMLLVLASQSRRHPPVFSLTAPIPDPTPGEAAVNVLLRLVRSPSAQAQIYRRKTIHAPTFFSSGQPRDRRGRIAQKTRNDPVPVTFQVGEDDGATPRNAPPPIDVDREREREILEALRSPEVDHQVPNPDHAGGWGLGAGQEDGSDEDDDEEVWATVEKMVGLNSNANARTGARQ